MSVCVRRLRASHSVFRPEKTGINAFECGREVSVSVKFRVWTSSCGRTVLLMCVSARVVCVLCATSCRMDCFLAPFLPCYFNLWTQEAHIPTAVHFIHTQKHTHTPIMILHLLCPTPTNHSLSLDTYTSMLVCVYMYDGPEDHTGTAGVTGSRGLL